MPDPLADLWEPIIARIRPGQEVVRPCGCRLDPVVFGHCHPAGCDAWGTVTRG